MRGTAGERAAASAGAHAPAGRPASSASSARCTSAGGGRSDPPAASSEAAALAPAASPARVMQLVLALAYSPRVWAPLPTCRHRQAQQQISTIPSSTNINFLACLDGLKHIFNAALLSLA